MVKLVYTLMEILLLHRLYPSTGEHLSFFKRLRLSNDLYSVPIVRPPGVEFVSQKQTAALTFSELRPITYRHAVAEVRLQISQQMGI